MPARVPARGTRETSLSPGFVKESVDKNKGLMLIGMLCGAKIASLPATGNALSITTVVLYRGHPVRFRCLESQSDKTGLRCRRRVAL